MKSALLMGLLLSGFSVHAQNRSGVEVRYKVLKNEQHLIQVHLDPVKDPQSVRCSAVGYSRAELKISVDDLNFISFFNHANPGESRPCMTAGVCGPGNMPEDLVRATGGFARATLQRVLVEKFVIDHAAKTCLRSLEETATAPLGGRVFKHVRVGDLGAADFQGCLNAR